MERRIAKQAWGVCRRQSDTDLQEASPLGDGAGWVRVEEDLARGDGGFKVRFDEGFLEFVIDGGNFSDRTTSIKQPQRSLKWNRSNEKKRKWEKMKTRCLRTKWDKKFEISTQQNFKVFSPKISVLQKRRQRHLGLLESPLQQTYNGTEQQQLVRLIKSCW